ASDGCVLPRVSRGGICRYFFQAEDGIGDRNVTGVQTCALPIFLSVDTWRGDVARRALSAGADLVNDTWAGHDPEVLTAAADAGAGFVCSHTGGAVPRTRPFRVGYEDVVADVVAELSAGAERALAAGVPRDGILVDPTHDFGKNTFHGLELVRRTDRIVALGHPVL